MYSRLTTATMYSSLMQSLQASQRNIQDLQRQIASGNKYNKLSDNPAAIARSLGLQAAINANDRYQTNTANAITMLSYSNSAMNNVLNAAQTIRSLIIQAGDGALPADELADISAQIEANKKIMLDNLNTRVAGQYIFGGTDTNKQPFIENSDGSITYQGTDERIRYAVNESLVGDVSFAGNNIVPENDDSYFICSHYVPLDWQWTGREEKVQITVGNRTLSVFIPENWDDNDYNKTNSEEVNYTDNNNYRDPNELKGISLSELASIVNQSLEEQGADMLVKAYIETDDDNSRQQLILKSITGEKIGITGWPDTDYMPVPATVTSKDLTGIDWKYGIAGPEGLMGKDNLLNWHGGTGTLNINVDSKTYNIDLTGINSITALVDEINNTLPSNEDGSPFASLTSGDLTGRLVLQSAKGSRITVTGTSNDDMNSLFGRTSISSTSSSLNITVGDDINKFTKIYINGNDTLSDVAERINSINGVYSRTTADNKELIILAQRTGNTQSDRLNINEAQEMLHYPSIRIKAEGEAARMYDNLDSDGYISAKVTTRESDHSHMDVFDVLGMETAMKSREMLADEILTVKEGTQLHWRVSSAGHTMDIKLNSGEYTLEELADRLKNAGAGWLEVTVETDSSEISMRGTDDAEPATQRLVIRGYNGEQVIFLDMNEYNYAAQLGLDTSLRTDGYTETYAGTGTKCVNFPSAPCVDDNTGIPMRVQMNCGMYYDVNIKKSDVIDSRTGFIDRNKVMKSITDQVNAQEGHAVMGYTVHVDAYGEEIADSSSIYFHSGEAFTVVDMPFNDPEWNDYSGGIAAQMGIHGGITSNLMNTDISMKDNSTFEEAYDASGETFRAGTIRFANLAHSVEIDVSPEDTVKDVIDRLRTQAGEWLYISYYDAHMGYQAARNTGDYPLISISSIDGSAVSVLDVKGHIAQDALGLSTGIQTRLNSDGTGEGIMADSFSWPVNSQTGTTTFPADTLTLTVAGYSHTIDLTEIRDVTADNAVKADDIAEFINARMQDYDIRAELNEDNELMLWSLRGYSISAQFSQHDTDVTDTFMGNEASSRTYYRGGRNLEGHAGTRGIDNDNFYSDGIHAQNAAIRSGANTMRQNGFGVINDVISAVNSGNREDLCEKMLPKIDAFINNILSAMSENGALQARYSYNTERLITENAIMTEDYDKLVKIDMSEAISQLMIGDYMYQANLAVIARLIQPSLLDFLS
ncbi:MAG: flagellar hook-associated protein FlgL [Synergistaceae bacterium]|nr:flagellar hook-associated protein FlgL [Synergistaceae bacterium]